MQENCGRRRTPGYWVIGTAMSRRNRLGNPWILRVVAALILAAVFGYGPYHLYAHSGLARYLQLRRDVTAMQMKNARLHLENERLARDIQFLRSDARSVERVARANLGWVRPGEVVFELGERR
jgi:cell division protein FtsB